MSKIGKQIINIPDWVEVKILDGSLVIKGKLGTLNLPILKYVMARLDGKILSFDAKEVNKQARANWGTMRSLAANAIKGVGEGFEETLEFEGIGFKTSMEGKNFSMIAGYTHPLKFITPAGINISLEKNTIKITGFDKQAVGEAAAKIRALRKPEPYKGTGIRYKGEVIKRKAGKKVASATAA